MVDAALERVMEEAPWSPDEVNERDVFLRALETENLEERLSFLEKICAGNPGLRARVELLLHCTAEENDFLESDPQELAMALPPPESNEQLPEPEVALGVFGKFTLLNVIARGAMGVVYKARQSSPDRIVALKMNRGAMLASEDEILFAKDGKGADRRWTVKGVIDRLVQIQRNRVSLQGVEFDQVTEADDEQKEILTLLKSAT